MLHTMTRPILLGLFLCAALIAQAPEKEGLDLEKKISSARSTIFGNERTISVTFGVDAGPDLESLRRQSEFREVLMELYRVHGPEGSGKRLECGPIYQALMGEDGALKGSELQKFRDSALKKDPESWGLVYVLEGLGPENFAYATFSLGSSVEAQIGQNKPSFDQVDGEDLAWALNQRAQLKEGIATEVLDLYFARCALAYGNVTVAKTRVEELTRKSKQKGRALTEVQRYAQNVIYAASGKTERSTWPNDSSERMAFRRLWHVLHNRDLKIESEAQRLALVNMGRGFALIPALLDRAQGKLATLSVVLKDDDGGRFLKDFLGHEAGTNTAWSKRLEVMKRGRIESRLEVIDLIYDYGLISPELPETLVDVATTSRDWRLRSMALRVLAFQQSALYDKSLARVSQDKVWQVRLSLAEALGSFPTREAVDLLVEILGDEHIRVRLAAGESLANLTGVALGTSEKRWQDWLDSKGPDWAVPDRKVARAMRSGAKADDRYAKYFDLVIPSNRLAFVLDKSESMYYGLWDGATEQVQNFLSEAGATTFFGIVEYDDGARLWKKNLMAANAANSKKACSFLVRGKPMGATNIVEGLRLAFQFNDCDAIVLLSDGLPNRGEPSTPQSILNAIEQENRYNRIAINTVQMLTGRSFAHDAKEEELKAALTAEEQARRDALREQAGSDELGGFLKKLAARNDGNYGLGFGDVHLPPPNSRFRPGTDR